ncbi:C45 family autoproteolytic acyltransferase/hydrolase [Klebsiella grimontii]|nr:C45 family peptidase [Klebsiella grimontii]MDD9673098.1 C45 family autoproteolytic acyltransferase/hydrolase [Klebsiella grimontii]MDD9679169.1 C45 family autoproteolytic acyltransferase/hydrolase [Klebsiella grimontii]MDD9688712.1 C45 family autoproteolytic acyltransferase/hydrolase [Klebsiella grimontii]MDD9698875.1 C45 family autoproteolytic acyltransferase/hydrolase [Klebsiella grimontii]MDD9710201.1 C45 family autoproteolytic acyltransferase/hydrolase [Klebsiella grimontii]
MKKIDISGSPFEIGLRLGELGREAWHQKLRLTSLWQTVMALQASPETRLMRAEVQRHYPHIWQELEGLAQGLEATVDQVFAWNCRGDLVRSTSDGCTTVAGVNAAGERIIAHNEDGSDVLKRGVRSIQVCVSIRFGPSPFLICLVRADAYSRGHLLIPKNLMLSKFNLHSA